MIIYDFDKKGELSLYEYLYECIKSDIQKGRIAAGQKLPSKRELAKYNGISVKTVMNAYEQLLTEGYIISEEKRGYFATETGNIPVYRNFVNTYPKLYTEEEWFADFTANNMVYERFPLATWSKVMRNTISEYDVRLLERAPFQGVYELREAIADYLYQFRGMSVSPECIIIGAGTEYLYGRLIRILPKDAMYVIETPGYRKIAGIYEEYGLNYRFNGVDENGIDMAELASSHADVVHVSPEHHFPLGTAMSAGRRSELLNWAAQKPERYIVEDDYDCEFRYSMRTIPALQSMDRNHRVIYMNTFSKVLAPSLRISYMVLPEKLMNRYIKNMKFYSNTASSYEQYVLAAFIKQGYFERHLSRMRKFYRQQRDMLIRLIKESEIADIAHISGGESGTHLLVKLDTMLSDVVIKWGARQAGINVAFLSEYCNEKKPEYEHTLVLNYSDMKEEVVREAVKRIGEVVKG